MNKKIFIFIFTLSLIMSACGSPSEADIAAISTQAAQTVEARFAEEAEVAPTPKPTESAPTEIVPSLAPPTQSLETPVSSIAPEGCLVASLVNETIPDRTILGTSEYFTKNWYIQNNGECTWNQEYKLLYWDGDLLGGYTEYAFPGIALPGETIDIPIQLRAPDSVGSYTGYWKMQSRSGYIFGVGEYNAPISVNIDVRDASDIEYGIISVEYYMTRYPESGCPANVSRTIYAIVSVSGPMEIRYQFYQRESNGEIVKQTKEWLRFTEAGIDTIRNEWVLNKCTNANPRFVSLVILDPETDQPIHQYPEFEFVNDCPDQCP